MSRDGGYRELYAPSFILRGDVPGVDLSDIAGNICALDYTEEVGKMDVASLVLRNPDFRYSDDRRFSGPLRFKLQFGYPNDFSEERVVVVRGASPSFDDSFPTIQLTAYDVGTELARGARPNNWGRVQTSYIAREVARKFGLRAYVEDSHDARSQAYVQPASVSSYEYLLQLSERIGWDFYVRGEGLYYHPMRTEEAPEFVYHFFLDGKGTLRRFVPEVRTATAPASRRANVSADGRTAHGEQTGQSPSDTRSGREMARYRTDFTTTTGRVVAGAERESPVTRPTPETSPEVQAAHARAAQTRIEMRATTAQALWIGQPRLTARRVVKVILPDPQYTGLWRLTKVSHRISATGVYDTAGTLARGGTNRGAAAHAVPTAQQNAHQTAQAGTDDGGGRYRTDFESTQGALSDRRRAAAGGAR